MTPPPVCTPSSTTTLYSAGVLVCVYMTCWVLFGDAMRPDGAGWCLALLYLCSRAAGKCLPLLSKRLPPLLAMLVVGLLLRNVPGGAIDATVPLLGHSFAWWSSRIRAAALAVIMLRAGLGIDLDKLWKLGLATARLALMPCLSEALLIMALSGPMLGLSPAWGGTLGFVIAAVSPAVVVPGMLDLAARGYGVAKGVPTMVVAAASFDDVLAIAGFGVCLALALSAEDGGGGGSDGGELVWLVLKAPVELLAGVGFGLVYGVFAAAPASEHALLRGGAWWGHVPGGAGTSGHFCALLAGALLAIFGGKYVGFSGGGALAAIVLGATAARLWTVPACGSVHADVKLRVNATWTSLQPALFGLLGAAVDVSAIDGAKLGGGLGMLACGLALRIGVTRLALVGSGLTAREARLVCVAWLPKATVQAAVGGTALDLVREKGYGADAEARGELILMLSVLIILLTAPVGAVGIAIFGPQWLSKDEAGDEEATATSRGPGAKERTDAPPPAAAGHDHVRDNFQPLEMGEGDPRHL